MDSGYSLTANHKRNTRIFMKQNAMDTLRKTLGPAASKLPDMSGVSEDSLAEFANAVDVARQRQKQLLEDSANHSLRLVPALLRPVVRKVLFG